MNLTIVGNSGSEISYLCITFLDLVKIKPGIGSDAVASSSKTSCSISSRTCGKYGSSVHV